MGRPLDARQLQRARRFRSWRQCIGPPQRWLHRAHNGQTFGAGSHDGFSAHGQASGTLSNFVAEFNCSTGIGNQQDTNIMVKNTFLRSNAKNMAALNNPVTGQHVYRNIISIQDHQTCVGLHAQAGGYGAAGGLMDLTNVIMYTALNAALANAALTSDGLAMRLRNVVAVLSGRVTYFGQLYCGGGTGPVVNADAVTAFGMTGTRWRTTGSADFYTATIDTSPGTTDPQLIDLANGNFGFKSTSPALGSGVAVAGLTTDYAGNAYRSPPSRGALERLA
jgi:hypothetical protein